MKSIKDLIQQVELKEEPMEKSLYMETSQKMKLNEEGQCLKSQTLETSEESESSKKTQINNIKLIDFLLTIIKELKTSFCVFNLKYIKNEDLKGIASSWENLLKLYNPNITVAQVQEGYNAALANFNPKENDEKTKNLDILDIKRYIIEKEKEEEERKQREELRVYKASLDKDYKIKCEKCYDNGWIILSETYKFQRKDILASSTKSCSCEAGQKYMAAYYAGIEKEKPIGFPIKNFSGGVCFSNVFFNI